MPAPIVRFAPSPTGLIHIGNARTALLNALYARREGGTFILRFDDTDLERSTRKYATAIETDLKWLGIPPDRIVRQSERFDLYHAVAERLKTMGRLYACYETPDELERRRKRQLARGLPPIYDRAALSLAEEDKRRLEAEGRRPHWRFRLDHRTIAWTDLVRGECHVDCASLSDPVLVRADGTYLYTLPSVADDIDLAITHVIRGEDHVTNTAVQVQIFEALGASAPAFAHHNLLTAASGEGLSKRLGHLSLASLREEGLEPQAVASLAVLVGSAEAVRPVSSLDELAGLIDFAHISRAPARFDESELMHLNARLVHGMSYEAVRDRLVGFGILWRGGVLERGPRQSGHGVRRRCVVARRARSGDARDRGPRLHGEGREPAAARALGRLDLEDLDRRRERRDGRERAGAVHAAASGAHGARGRAGAGWPSAADRL